MISYTTFGTQGKPSTFARIASSIGVVDIVDMRLMASERRNRGMLELDVCQTKKMADIIQGEKNGIATIIIIPSPFTSQYRKKVDGREAAPRKNPSSSVNEDEQ